MWRLALFWNVTPAKVGQFQFSSSIKSEHRVFGRAVRVVTWDEDLLVSLARPPTSIASWTWFEADNSSMSKTVP